MGGPEKAKEVGLLGMFVGPARDAGLGHRNVRHGRMIFGGQLVMAKQLAQPAARIMIFLERFPHNAFDRTGMKLHEAFSFRITRYESKKRPFMSPCFLVPRFQSLRTGLSAA